MVTFKSELMFRFIIERFEGTSSVIQEQALSWLQVLRSFTGPYQEPFLKSKIWSDSV